jgi:hypothetical protein
VHIGQQPTFGSVGEAGTPVEAWHKAQAELISGKVALCAVHHAQRCRAVALLLSQKSVNNTIGTMHEKLLAQVGRLEVSFAP